MHLSFRVIVQYIFGAEVKTTNINVNIQLWLSAFHCRLWWIIVSPHPQV